MTSTAKNVEPEPTPSPGSEDDNKPPLQPVNVEVKTNEVDTQVNSGAVTNQHNYFGDARKPEAPVSSLRAELSPKLPSGLHPFRHPNHEQLLGTLEERRILVLISYRNDAAYAAGHALAYDRNFNNNRKRTLYLTRQRDKERPDLELMSMTEGDFLDEPQIFLIGIRSKCTFLDSVLDAAHDVLGKVCEELERHRSYVVLSIDEKLLEDDETTEKISVFYTDSVSHFRYLLSPHFTENAADFETRLRDALGTLSTPAQRREHYQRIADTLSQGTTTFKAYLEQLEAAMHLAPELRIAQLRTIEPSDVFKEGSEVHRATAFVAACFPELHQEDFDRFVLLLLADETTTKENVRQGFRRDGKLVTVREEKQEPCSDQWLREPDKIFHDCHLRTIVSGNGSWVVDFCEPYLRDELRSYLDKHHPWYLRRQCQRLQRSGILFDRDLSPKGVEGLVQLFVERAIVDPTGFGSIWLLQLVVSARSALSDGSLPESPDETLAWLSEKLAQLHLRIRFHERLSVLIREMLDHDVLRPVVRQFFEHLLTVKQHDALLDVILNLAASLRLVPDFDPLIWLRRLLDEGSRAVAERTRDRLTDLARRSGPKIYDFLATIHEWLPDNDCKPENYSFSHFVAIKFPFIYCAEMARWITTGVWPSQHPLFYALPGDMTEARKKVEPLIEWIVDTRGAAFETANATDPLKTVEAARMELVADLVEHWAWVLEGPPSQTPPPEGQALFNVILEELDSRLGPRERTWLQRSWQRSQEEQLKKAGTRSGPERRNLIARKTKLEQLRMRYASMASTQKIRIQGEQAS